MNNETGLIKLPKRKKSNCRKEYFEDTEDNFYTGSFIIAQTKLFNPQMIYEGNNPLIIGQNRKGMKFYLSMRRSYDPEHKTIKLFDKHYDPNKTPKSIWIHGKFGLWEGYPLYGKYTSFTAGDLKSISFDDKPICGGK